MSTRNSLAFQNMLNSTSTLSFLTAFVQGTTARAAAMHARKVRPAKECLRSTLRQGYTAGQGGLRRHITSFELNSHLRQP